MTAVDTPQHLLDTHACLHLIRCGPDGNGGLRDLFDHCAPGDVAISSLTLAALRARARHSRQPEQNRQALEQFVLPLVILDFDAEAAAWLARLSTAAESQGYRAGHEEMLAAQALSRSAELITSHPDLYAAVPELRLRTVGAQAPRLVPSLTADVPLAALPLPRPAPAAERKIIIAGSHDFTLDLLAQQLRTRDPALAVSIGNVGSLSGLLALQQRSAHIAGAHLLDEETGDFNRGYIRHLLTPLGVRVVLLGFVERIQGLIVRPGNLEQITRLDDLARPDVTFVNRQRGSGTRILLDYHLRRGGLDAQHIRGYDQQEPTHLAVAAAVADGRADCGMGVLAAAHALDLDFVPLFNERYDLVIPVEHYNSPLLAPLLTELRHPDAEFVRKVDALGGYVTTAMGKVLAEL